MHSVITTLSAVTPQQVIDRLLAEVEVWTGRNFFHDDLTILVLRVK
jgi:serine phosphatase RsbU (regulator of sigma subunit)